MPAGNLTCVKEPPAHLTARENVALVTYISAKPMAAVKVARRNNAEAMIEDGVKPGERVVVYPSDALKDGARVEVRSPR